MGKNLWTLIALHEKSQLKVDLNRGIASLVGTPETHFQPHICLNKLEGVSLIQRIAEDPEGSDTEIWIGGQINGSSDDWWLNVKFSVFLNEISWPNSNVDLSPRQTSYIVSNLPPESKAMVVSSVQAWFQGKFVPDIQKAFQRITKQFTDGGALVAGVHKNRIFDIHDGDEGHEGVEYTEMDIIGLELFWKFFLGHTLFHHGQNGYERIDSMLLKMEGERKAAIDTTLSILRSAMR